ncbi:bifunctional oligoribonuclease/PAP phosphatase NrnA [Alkalihalobacillus macyae]|uniref:DHH family phosphoesterase n=1 Tax=Guptibacillus hwajinpoensis TaxID=208199 RepID=UPI00273B09EB|nr:bifunctional oligoribonuclease/PAP phosphatase NrnA [Alkalihalobacillus macyae]MDP4550911.1 bifunctional oligoribonuclease/PAP phosphatase NrnA [Alkalihalobacillus macyae]
MKEQILAAIEEHETIIIHRHVRPDPDALGSQGGLAELIQTTFPEKRVFIVGEEEPSLLFLNRMDEVTNEEYESALVIVCDTANQPRISDDRYRNGKLLIKIDHHPNEDPYGDLLWVDTNSSSVSEMIVDLYVTARERGYKLSDKGAFLLYAGIVGDTGRFMFSNTTQRTFQYAGELLEIGVDTDSLYNELYKTEKHIARLNGHVLQNFETSENGAGWIKITKETIASFGVTASESSQLVNSFSNVAGLKAWVFFIEEADQIRVRLRSKGPVVNTIAANYNGGGHPRAAGATVYTWEEADRVLADLQEACLS